jgi:purine-cytosine permease-like protein
VSNFSPTKNDFSGFLTFSRYENCAWIPSLFVFLVVTGVGGKHFADPPVAPATAAQIFSFGATIAGFVMTWSVLSSDYTAYFHPRVSRFVKFCGAFIRI